MTLAEGTALPPRASEGQRTPENEDLLPVNLTEWSRRILEAGDSERRRLGRDDEWRS